MELMQVHFRLSVVLAICFLFGCAKPNDPELMVSAGGYRIVGTFQTPGNAQDVVVKDSLAYIAQGEGGLIIVNVANPSRPVPVATCMDGVRGYSAKVAVKDTVVYVAAGTFGVSVVNVANPATPFATASNLAMKPARSFHILGEYLFTAVSEQGVKIAEIAFPEYPDIRGGIQAPGYSRGMATTPDSTRMLIACGEMGLSLHDISDMQSGFGQYPQLGWCDTPGYAEAVATMGDQPIAFVACGTAGVVVMDFSDTSNMRIIGSYATRGFAKEIGYRNGRVYVTTERRGLQVLNVETPASPMLVGIVQTQYAMGLALGERHIYIADDTGGLVIVGIPDAEIARDVGKL